MKDSKILKVLDELERLEETSELPEGLWHISRETGLFFNALLRHSKAKRILEIGTSSGYSGLFLADAARANGGKLITCEYSDFKIKLAKQTFEKAGLSEYVELIEGDALQTIESLEGSFDCVFLDATKDEYPFYLSMVWDKLSVGGIILADNMISHQDWIVIEAYKGLARLMDEAVSVTVPIGNGIEFTCKIK
ncbi:O-methyltransferase [Alicyclobacillus macrosporangiidus]|uniref:O-methyltransferase n=1 Tax=Alicyclobacillus macrosporangiidus TaxID=392015 RepID=UPI0005597FFF|nr:O-methyltransferase [Alicyclobacillus macrosporangiidus]